MLLAGIIITIAFILTALTLQQVGALERQAAAEPPLTLAAEWRFMHDRVASNVAVSVDEGTSNDTFVNNTFPAIAATFRAAEAEKGYDVTLRLANSTAKVNKTEASIVDGSKKYQAWSFDGKTDYSNKNYDGTATVGDQKDDGILHEAPCPSTNAGYCIGGVLVYVHLSDGASSLDEVMLLPTNQG